MVCDYTYNLGGTTVDKCFRSGFLTDLHFGHRRVHPNDTYLSLRKYFYPVLPQLNALFYLGDLTDKSLQLNQAGSFFAITFLLEMLAYSNQTNMPFRVLMGTYSHDREQPNILAALNTTSANCKVISTIDIESIPVPNQEPLRVIYVPDSLPYKTSDDVIDKIKELFQIAGWDKADLLIGHGTFAHALPDAPDNPTHYHIEQFQDILRGYGLLGHIHKTSKRKNIIYVGSFDRLAHNEEGKKGFMVGDMYPDRTWSFKFIENKDATPFVTCQPTGQDTDEIIADFIRQVEAHHLDHGYIRVVHEDANIRNVLHKICKTQFPDLIYSAKAIDQDDVKSLQLEQIQLAESESLVLDLPTLVELIYQRLKDLPEYQNYQSQDFEQAILDLGITPTAK